MGIKIDFGRIFPGLVVFLVGLALLVLWVLLALLGLVLFFIPPLQGMFYAALYVGAAALILMGSGVLMILAGISGWSWTARGPERREEPLRRRHSADALSVPDRAGELFGLLISALVLLFFYENQARATGFFTPAFGFQAQAIFYGPWFFGAAVTLARVAVGRRNAVRPLQALQGLLWALAAYWLLAVFPFNFAHMTDLLPHAIRFAFVWVNDQVGAIILLLLGIGSLASMVYNAVRYIFVRLEDRG